MIGSQKYFNDLFLIVDGRRRKIYFLVFLMEAVIHIRYIRNNRDNKMFIRSGVCIPLICIPVIINNLGNIIDWIIAIGHGVITLYSISCACIELSKIHCDTIISANRPVGLLLITLDDNFF